MSSSALKRIMRELKELTTDAPFEEERCTVLTKNDDYFAWQATLTGPPGTPYEEGLFFLDVDFPTDYPFKPPKLRFTTSIFHMNISDKGEICLDIIKDKWSPGFSIKKVLQDVMTLVEHPNLESPLRSDIAKLYKDDRAEHDRQAAEFTKKYAQ